MLQSHHYRHQAYLALLLSCLSSWISAPAFGAQQLANPCQRAVAKPACLTGVSDTTSGAAMHSCASAVQADPANLDARYGLCQVYLAKGATLDALVTLDQGLSACHAVKSTSARVCRTLAITLSNLEEAAQQESRDLSAQQRSQAKADAESEQRICHKPLNGDLFIRACQKRLRRDNADITSLQALANKLLQRDAPVTVLNLLAQHTAGDAGWQTERATLLQTAESKRQLLSQRCMNENDLPSCDSALLVGATNEATLQWQRADLRLQQSNLTSQQRNRARDALIRALMLQPNNQIFAQRLAPLMPTGVLHTAEGYAARGHIHQQRQEPKPAIAAYNAALKAKLDPAWVAEGLAQARQSYAKIQQARQTKRLAQHKPLPAPAQQSHQQPKPAVVVGQTPPTFLAVQAAAKSPQVATKPEPNPNQFANSATLNGTTH